MKKGSKKIVSKTIATALATTNLVGISSQAVNAFEKNIDANNVDNVAENTVDVTVENTEKIEESSTEIKENVDNSKNPQYSNNEESIENIGTTETEEVEDVQNNDLDGETVTDGAEEQVVEEQDTVSKDPVIENKDELADKEVLEEKKESLENSVQKSLGKLELDINFPMPIVNLEKANMKFSLFRDGVKVGELSDLSKDEGTLDNGVTYKIEKLNSIKKPLKDGENNIYFLHVTFNELELGNYSVEVSGDSYLDTKVDDIEIINYSKRVILGSGSKSASNYNGVFLVGDVNGDGIIDMGDYNLVFENLGKVDSSAKAIYDLNRDGNIDIADLTYVNENIGAIQGEAIVIDTDAILNPENVQITGENISLPDNIKDILVDSDKAVAIGKADGQAPTQESPLRLDFDLSSAARNNGAVDMEQVVIQAPKVSNNENAGAPSQGSIIYTDANGNENEIPFGDNEAEIASYGVGEGQPKATTSENGDIVIDLGKQVAVKKISINVTGNRGNKNISEIAKIEFLNNVYKEIPKPDMNRPQIKTVETSTDMHDERITLTWDAQPNVTGYEVKYQKLDENNNVQWTKTLQTNKTRLNILDKDIKPYDLYRVSIQSLNGEWSSGYEAEVKLQEIKDIQVIHLME